MHGQQNIKKFEIKVENCQENTCTSNYTGTQWSTEIMTDGNEVTWFHLASLSSADAAMTCLFAEAHSRALAVVMRDYSVCSITGF
jgi:hypothetical protein